MCVMQVIRRADRHIVYPVTFSPQQINMPVKPLKLGEEISVGEMAIDHANLIAEIQRGHEPVTRILDRFHVARSDVTGSADEYKIFHIQALEPSIADRHDTLTIVPQSSNKIH